jgi:GNAT superfamily N-acetyltransferase
MFPPLHVVTMVRENRACFPHFALPPGYSLHWYQPGDEAIWLSIQRAADRLQDIPPDSFARTFGDARDELPQRQCFLLSPQGEPIGTATAWFGDERWGREWGKLHWVAIVPGWQGKGLARPLLSCVCGRLRELHPDRAYLRTAAERLVAIRLYLDFGFQPDIANADEAHTWSEIMKRLPRHGSNPV